MAVEAQNGAGAGNGAAAPPPGILSVVPKLFVESPKANDAVEFYKAAFGATVVNRDVHPKRKAEQEEPSLVSATIMIGETSLLVADLDDDSVSKDSIGKGFTLCLVTDDVKAVVENAVSAGAVAHGESDVLSGKVKDPFGYVWIISLVRKAKVPCDD